MKIYDCVQGSQEWFDLRLGRPTASEFHRIITAVKADLSAQADGYVDQLIGEKLAIHYPERAESYTSRAMDWGQQTEEEARRWYAMETGLEVIRVGFITTDDGRFGASPDGIIVDKDAPIGGLELKCPEPETQVRRLREQKLPNESKAQVHGGLAVSGLPFWDYLSYCPGLPPFMIRVTPDEYSVKLTMALQMFWARYEKALAKVMELKAS